MRKEKDDRDLGELTELSYDLHPREKKKEGEKKILQKKIKNLKWFV
jgi:hypothetical protein